MATGPDQSKLEVHSNKRMEIKKNNCALNLRSTDFTEDQQILIDVLKKHPLRLMFSKKFQVHVEYLQQWWCFFKYERETDEITSYVGGYKFCIKETNIKSFLDLPEAEGVVGKTTFDAIPKNTDMIADFMNLGYSETLNTLSAFKRKCLTPIWYFLFSIINTCLSGKILSLNQASTNGIIIFYGIAHNMHYNYASLLFEELKISVSKKCSYNYIPFQRFFQIFIKGALHIVPTIPSLEDAPQVPLLLWII